MRRIALVASLLVLGGALAAATLLPAAVEVQGRAIRATNRFGLPTRSAQAPSSIIPSAPRIDSRRFLAGLMREPGMPREAPSLAVFDGLSGTLTPLPFSRDVLGVTCDTVFPRLSCDYGLSKLVAVPDEPGFGIPRFAAVYTHLLEHSNLLVVFDGSGTALAWLPFAGAIQKPVFLPARGDPPHPPLLVASVEFHDLGQRLGIVALPLTFNGTPVVGAFEAPPYDLPVHDTIARRPEYVTFAPVGRYAEASVGPDGRLQLARSDGPPLAFDARSGVPLDGPDAPRDPTAWLAAQGRLLEVLEQAARHGAAGLPGEGASLLERFADAEARAPSQRGTALGLAAALRRRTGELDQALEDARKARAEEPELLGHQRLLIDLLARSGSWSQVQQALLSFDLGARSAQDLPADAVAAALMLRRAAEARQIMEKAMGAPLRPDERQVGNALFQALLALEEGAPERVEALLAPVPWASEYSQVALVGAIAAALRDPFDPEAVARWEGAARTGCGVSVAAPLVAVDALVAARTGQPGPTEAQLADALARQDAAGREHLVELLLARWAHRLADEAAKVSAQPR